MYVSSICENPQCLASYNHGVELFEQSESLKWVKYCSLYAFEYSQSQTACWRLHASNQFSHPNAHITLSQHMNALVWSRLPNVNFKRPNVPSDFSLQPLQLATGNQTHALAIQKCALLGNSPFPRASIRSILEHYSGLSHSAVQRPAPGDSYSLGFELSVRVRKMVIDDSQTLPVCKNQRRRCRTTRCLIICVVRRALYVYTSTSILNYTRINKQSLASALGTIRCHL